MRLRRVAASALALVALLAVAVAWLGRPLPARGLGARPRPAADFADAERRIAALAGLDGAEIAPVCGTRFFSHGGPTRRVVVLLHGLTNCPAQFDSLGRRLHARGANVLVPRLPRHGRADRLTDDPAGLGAEELRDFTDRAIDAAAGLGDEVVLVGLSVGGTMAAWGAQNRGEVDRAVVIAPLLAPPGMPEWAGRAATRLASALPNRFVWWDDEARADLAGPRHVYPRFATRAVASSLVLAGAVLEQARRGPPAFRSAAVVTLETDPAVGNATTAALVRSWREAGARDVATVELPDSLRLVHDMIDPDQVGARIDVSYPVLEALILR